MKRSILWVGLFGMMSGVGTTAAQADCLTVKWAGIGGAKMFVRSSAGLLTNCPGQSSYIHVEAGKSSHDQLDTSFLVTGKRIQVDGLDSSRDGAGSESVVANVSGVEVPSGKSIRVQLSGFKGALPHLNASPLYMTVWVDGKASFQATLNGSASYEKVLDQLSMR